MPQGTGFKVEQIVWNQGLEEEMESAGSEHISHLSSKNSGTKPSLWCSKQHSTPPTPQNRGDAEGSGQEPPAWLHFLCLRFGARGKRTVRSHTAEPPQVAHTPKFL